MIATPLDKRLPAGLYRCPPENWPACHQAAGEAGIQVLESSLAGAANLVEALRGLAADLRFPHWFGNNLDALYDTLTDPGWHQGRPQMIHLGETTGTLSPDAVVQLLEVLESAVETRQQDGAPLWIVLGFAAAGVLDLPQK